MKILFASLGIYSRLGGEQRYDQALVSSLADLAATSGTRATVVALWDGREDAGSSPDGVRFAACGRRKWLMLARFIACLVAERPDVIVYGHVLLAPLAFLARVLRPGARRVLVVYGLEVWDPPGRLRRAVVARSAHVVVSVSRFTAETMARSYHLPQGMFRTLPPAVADPPPAGRRGQIAKSLLSVTRLDLDARYKGIDVIIDALPLVLGVHPEARIEVIGDGPLRAELEDRARRLGVSHAVVFRGAVDDGALEQAYRSAEVFVLPSTREGFGIVFLEAWRHALPVVAVEAAAATDVLEGGALGVLVPPGNPRALADAIVGLLDDPEHARALGRAGLEVVRARYSSGAFTRKLEEILDESPVGSVSVHAGGVAGETPR